MLWRLVWGYTVAGGLLDALRRRPHAHERAALAWAEADVLAAYRELAQARREAREIVIDAEHQAADARREMKRAQKALAWAERRRKWAQFCQRARQTIAL